MAFTKLEENISYISQLPAEPNDTPTASYPNGMSASQLQAEFDKAGNKVKTYLNNLIDDLAEESAAGSIGFDNDDTQLTSTTIQGALEELDTVARQSAAGVVSDNSISAAKLQVECVITEKIYDGAVTTDKLASAAVTDAKLAANAVLATNINDGAVTEDKIAGTAVTETKIGQGAVTTDKLGAGAVTAAKTSFLPSTYYGNSKPSNDFGSDGQIYFVKVT